MGLVLNYTDWGIREIPILTAISVFTLLMCAVAYYRRRLLPETEVFDIQFKAAFSDMTADIKKSGSAIDRFLAIFLILSVIASVVSLAYIIGTPKEGEHFTEFYILGPNRTADNYQTDFIQGEKGTVYVGIINHEYRPVDYTLDVKLGNKSLPISENQRQIKLAHNETWEAPVTFTPSIEGTNMKLEFLLFNETEKTTPYRNVHLWVNVTKET
jgi:uncharacterized membrane protein